MTIYHSSTPYYSLQKQKLNSTRLMADYQSNNKWRRQTERQLEISEPLDPKTTRRSRNNQPFDSPMARESLQTQKSIKLWLLRALVINLESLLIRMEHACQNRTRPEVSECAWLDQIIKSL